MQLLGEPGLSTHPKLCRTPCLAVKKLLPHLIDTALCYDLQSILLQHDQPQTLQKESTNDGTDARPRTIHDRGVSIVASGAQKRRAAMTPVKLSYTLAFLPRLNA
jgi:hypothetical protein